MADNNTTDIKTTGSEKPTVTIKDQAPSDFKPVFAEILDKSENLDRRTDKGIVNNKTGSSVVVRDDGQINMSSSETSQYKVNPDGKTEEISLESITKTNRKNYQVDDFVINNHKMNPQLWEMSDMRQLFDDEHYAAGGLCMLGTMMVKAWDTELRRYVLIRRLVNLPMFYQEMNTAKIPDGLNISDSTVVANTYDTKASESTNSNSTTADSGTSAVKNNTNTSTNTSDSKTASTNNENTTSNNNTTATTNTTTQQEENNNTPTGLVSKAILNVSDKIANGESAANILNDINTSTNGVIKKAQEQVNELTSKNTNSKAQEYITKTAREKEEELKKIATNKIKNTTSKITSNITNALGDLTKNINSSLSLTTDTVKNNESIIDANKQIKNEANNTAETVAATTCNQAINDIKDSANYLSKDLDLGISAIDKQLTDIKNDLVEQTKKEMAGQNIDTVKSSCQSVLLAADKAFSENKLELLKTAQTIQTEGESYIKSYIDAAKQNGNEITGADMNDLYKSVYSAVKKELLKNDSLNNSISVLNEKIDITSIINSNSKESINEVAKKIKDVVYNNAKTIINSSVMNQINIDIEKQKETIKKVENQIKQFEQEEIKRVEKIINDEVNKIVSSAVSEATQIISDTIGSLVSKL